MKLQHLAVIFVIIILPISLVMTQYIQTHINTITMQTLYTQSLNNATQDAIKAFQINTVNNKYSSISDSKIRDVEASVSTFYNSLITSMDKNVSTKEEISSFVPAIVFTMYDGYYIYSTYENIYNATEEGKVQINDNNKNYQLGLRPYIYYSCTYNLNGEKIIVNYTLDNSITVYGKLTDVDGTKKYVSKSGHLIDYRKVTDIDETNKTLKYDGVMIEPEILTEHLLIITDDSNIPVQGDYNYIIYNNKKVYYDYEAPAGQTPYFWYDNYKKTYLQSEALGLKQTLDENGVGFKCISAFEYYLEAYEFSKWLVETSGMKSITQANIVQNNGTIGANTSEGNLYLSIDTGTDKIFDTTDSDNDPMLSSSIFNAHREAVIRKSIETNLLTAIANYNIQDTSSYEFTLPFIDEENWYKITNNISIISFLQGIPISQKYYNNYSVITNTKNEEIINEQSLYIIAENSEGKLEYHQPTCKQLIEMQKADPNIEIIGYTALSYLRQTVKIDESNMNYFYPQSRNGKTITGCYNCIVNATADYDIEGLIKGKIQDYKTGNVLYSENDLKVVRQAYFEVWAREKYNMSNLTNVKHVIESTIQIP